MINAFTVWSFIAYIFSFPGYNKVNSPLIFSYFNSCDRNEAVHTLNLMDVIVFTSFQCLFSFTYKLLPFLQLVSGFLTA